MKTEGDILIDAISGELYERIGDASIFSLPWIPQVVLLILAAQGIIDNGGFIYFLENDWPDNPSYSVFGNACRAVGAEECADCVEVAAKLFPFSEPHLYCEPRRIYPREHCMIGGRGNDSSILVKLGDGVIDHSETNYYLLARYIRQHLHKIRNA